MREICKSGSTRGSNGTGASPPLLSTLPVILLQTATQADFWFNLTVLGVSPRGNKAQEQPMTGQSLYCLAAGNLQHKILAIVEEQGAHKAGYGVIWNTSPCATTLPTALRAAGTPSRYSCSGPSNAI